MNDYSNLSDEELDKVIASGGEYDPFGGGAGSAQANVVQHAQTQPARPDSEVFSGMSDADLDRVIESGGSWMPDPRPAPPPARADDNERRQMSDREFLDQYYGSTGSDRQDNGGSFMGDAIDALSEGMKGRWRATKALVKPFVGLGTGALRLEGTRQRLFGLGDGLHRIADSIDDWYDNFGAGVLESEIGVDKETNVGTAGEKIAGTAGSLASLAMGGAASKLGAAGKLGKASEAAAVGGTALQKALPYMFGNDAAVRTYETAKDNGSGTARALGLAAVNGAIHFLGFKLFENKSLNKMLGMPAEMEAMMPKWAGEAGKAGANTFSGLVNGVRNGMFKYILAERAKGALKAGGIMGLQNFLSSLPTQAAEGGDIDWARAAMEGAEGVGEGALMEGLMGGASALLTPRDARNFISNNYYRNGYEIQGGKRVRGLLDSPEGRMFLMKQNPEAQANVINILEHGGKLSPAELDAACLPPDMTEAEQRKFAKDWRKDIDAYTEEAWNADNPSAVNGSDAEIAMRDANAAEGERRLLSADEADTQQREIDTGRAVDEAWNADNPNRPAPPIEAAEPSRYTPLSAGEAEAQLRPKISVSPAPDEAPNADGAQEQSKLREEATKRREAATKSQGDTKAVDDEINGFFDAVDKNGDVLGNAEFNARNADVLAEVEDAIRRNNPQMVRDALNKLKKKVKNFAKKNRLRPAAKADETPAEQPAEQTKQPKEVTNETGNVPVEAQPEPPVQDAGRGGLRTPPQAADGSVEGEAPRGEVPAAGEVAEARPADAKPAAPAPAATQEQKPAEQKPVSKSDRGGQKLTGEVSAVRDEPTSKPLSEMTNDELLSAITAIDADGKMEPDAYKKAIKPYKDEIARRNAIGRGAKPDEANDVQITENVSKRTMDDAFGDFIDENGKPKTISQLIDNGWRVEKTRTGAASRYRLVKDGVDGFHDLSSKKIKGRMRPGNYAWNIEAATKYSDSAEPPKKAPASAPRAEGTTTPPQSAEPVQGAETVAGGAAGGATEEPKPTQGNKLRRGKKGKKLEAQEPKADAAPAKPASPATQEAAPEATTSAPAVAEQAQPASKFRDKNGNMKKTLRRAVERIASAIGNRTGKGAITPEEADGIVNGIAESPEVKHNRTVQFFTPLVTDAEWQNSLGVDAESAKNLRDAAVRASDASQRKKKQVKLDNAVKKAEAGDKDAPTAYGLVRIASDALDKARTKGDKAAEARAQKALDDANAKFNAEYEQVPEANREKWVKEQEAKFQEWSKNHDDVARNESVTADAPIQGKDGSSTTMAEQLPAKGVSSGDDRGGFKLVPWEDGELVRKGRVKVEMRLKSPTTGKMLSKTVEMSRTELAAKLGKNRASDLLGGHEILASVGAPESPASRDAKFAADADYQRWLKSRKANDAEPLRQRYEMEQAKALGDAYQNAVRGVDVEYVDRDYDPAIDGGGDGRKSIGGIFTGGPNDYANRSRRGGVDDGPSLHKIGTGEGTQVYGWGLYGSDQRGVAEEYANRGKYYKLKLDGKDVDQDGGTITAARALYESGMDYDKAVESLKERLAAKGKRRMSVEAISLSDAIEILEQNKGRLSVEPPSKSYVYEQTFFTDRSYGNDPFSSYEYLLEWYRPIGIGMGKKVMEGARRLFYLHHLVDNDTAKAGKALDTISSWTGEQLYKKLADAFGPERASNLLVQAGIDGIRYPVDSYGKPTKDGNTAGWDYVSFRDDNIRVDHKWEDGNLRYLRDRGTGTVLGIFDRDTGKLKLFRGANWKTLNHELGGHATMRFAEQEAERGNRALLDKINEAIDNAPQWLKDEVRRRYPGADRATLRDEIWAALRERPSEAMQKYVKTLQGRKWYNRAWDAIKTAWRGILSRMGFNRADLSGIDKMTPDEFNEFLDKVMIGGKTLGRIETASPQSSVRMSRGPAAPGTPIMDDKRTVGEKAREKFLDSDAPYRDLQDEVGGAKEVVRADGYTDHRAEYDVMRDASGRAIDEQGRPLDAQNRVLDKAGNVVKDKAGNDVYSAPAPDYSKAPLKEGSTDFVAAKDKYNGRLEYESRDLQRRVDAVKADLNAARLDTQKSKKGSDELLKDFNLFLAAEHAAERNRTHALEHGAKPDPDYYHGMGKVVWGGVEVGFSEHVADMIKKDLQNKYGAKFSHFEDAAKKAYKIAADELKRRLDGDLISQADYDYYHDRVASGEWAHYVPLKTDRLRLGIDDGDIPLGSKLHRNEYRKASGRGETVAELAPFTDLVLQAEQGIKKSLLNELANVEANFVVHATNMRGFKDAAGNSLIAEIVPGMDVATHGKNYRFVFGDGSSVVSEGSSKLAGNHPEIHLFKRGGRLMAIRYVKGKNGRGLEVAKAASGENVESWGDGVLSKIPKFTQLMSAMRTQYSPEFTVSNWLADSLEAAQALVGRYGVWDGAAAFGKTVASEIRNAKDVWRYLRKGELRGDVKKAIEAGLLTKGGVASEGFEGKEADIRDRLDEFRRQSEGFLKLGAADKAKWVAEHVMEYLSLANEFMEYSTRIGLFSALHNKGVPVQDAVKFARDATVNFNRKGTLMPIINGLYMFANASVQGSARAVQAGRESFKRLPDDGSGWGKHKVNGDLVALLVAVGAAQAVVDHFIGNDDEREKAGGRNARNRSEYDKKHNVGIPLPGGYNMPLLRFRGPYAAIPYLAQTATNVALGDADPSDAAWALARETTDQATDLVGGNGVLNDKNEVDGSLLWQSVAPSAIDPVVQLMSGKDYKGEERLRRSFDKNAPVSWNGKRNTSELYKKPVQFLNWLTGGNSLRKGKVDIAPEDAQLVWEFIWGGLGRDISNVASTVQNVSQKAAGGKPERLLQDIPLARRLVSEYPESTGRYYDALDEYERDKAEFKKTTELGRRAKMKKAHPYLTAKNGRVDSLVEQVQELTHRERGEVKVGQKWVPMKTELPEPRKEAFRKRRLRLQAEVLRILGK